jgi:hypothetical protein
MLRRPALVGTDIAEECIASIFSVTTISEGPTLAVTINRNTLQRNKSYEVVPRFLSPC